MTAQTITADAIEIEGPLEFSDEALESLARLLVDRALNESQNIETGDTECQ